MGLATTTEINTNEKPNVFWNKLVNLKFPADLVTLTSQLTHSCVPLSSREHVFLNLMAVAYLNLRFLRCGRCRRQSWPQHWGHTCSGPSHCPTAAFPGKLPATQCTLGLERLISFSWFVNRIVQKSMQINCPNQNLLS